MLKTRVWFLLCVSDNGGILENSSPAELLETGIFSPSIFLQQLTYVVHISPAPFALMQPHGLLSWGRPNGRWLGGTLKPWNWKGQRLYSELPLDVCTLSWRLSPAITMEYSRDVSARKAQLSFTTCFFHCLTISRARVSSSPSPLNTAWAKSCFPFLWCLMLQPPRQPILSPCYPGQFQRMIESTPCPGVWFQN